jgi:hypothetical protein
LIELDDADFGINDDRIADERQTLSKTERDSGELMDCAEKYCSVKTENDQNLIRCVTRSSKMSGMENRDENSDEDSDENKSKNKEEG